jgi:hypothetical protein
VKIQPTPSVPDEDCTKSRHGCKRSPNSIAEKFIDKWQQRVNSDRPGAPWWPSDDRNPLKADMISLRQPVSRRVNRTGGSDDPKLIAEVTLAGT